MPGSCRAIGRDGVDRRAGPRTRRGQDWLDVGAEGALQRGHEVDTPLAWTMAVGGMHGISRNTATGAMAGACDPRRDGFVAAL